MAINKAQDVVAKTGDLPVPLHLRNAPTKLMKQIGYGDKYQYAHDHKNNFVELEFLPEQLIGTPFYKPGSNKREQQDAQKIKERWKGKY
jgi:putative ATPase